MTKTGDRVRFAPSPTGFLHIGGVRTALYNWLWAKRTNGTFVLRIEDTDRERSTQASVQAIFDSMKWCEMEWDEGPLVGGPNGPYFQTERLELYKQFADQLIDRGFAYRCYATKEELDAERERQKQAGNPYFKYPGWWRDKGPKDWPDSKPYVVRLKAPRSGSTGWNDVVKGRIDVPNDQQQDVVLVRGDGVPLYNFGAVVDDVTMGITLVARGDDHVVNTPVQILLYEALGAKVPKFAHLPMILGQDGQKLSKRHAAVSVTEWRDAGYLPDAVLNYLARLGWSHGDAEKFSMAQLVEWFDLRHISKSPARFDPEKLAWLNQQYLKEADDARLAALMAPFLERDGCVVAGGPDPRQVVGLLKERVSTIEELADAAVYFYRPLEPSAELRKTHYTAASRPALAELHGRLAAIEWSRANISAAMKAVVAAQGLKFPQLAMPLRVMVTGEPQTPSVDATLELIGRERVLERMAAELAHFQD